MRCEIAEFDKHTTLRLYADSVQEAAALARLAANTRRVPPSIATFATRANVFTSVHMPKRADETSLIGRPAHRPKKGQ